MKFIVIFLNLFLLSSSFAYNHPWCASEEAFKQNINQEKVKFIANKCREQYGIQPNVSNIETAVRAEEGKLGATYAVYCERCAKESKLECEKDLQSAIYLATVEYQTMMRREYCL